MSRITPMVITREQIPLSEAIDLAEIIDYKRAVVRIFPWNLSFTGQMSKPELEFLRNNDPAKIAHNYLFRDIKEQMSALDEIKHHGLLRKSVEIAREIARLDPVFISKFTGYLRCRGFNEESIKSKVFATFIEKLDRIAKNPSEIPGFIKVVYIQ